MRNKFLSVHACADLIGDFFEQAAHELYGGERGVVFWDAYAENDGTTSGICPDIINWPQEYLMEVKAAQCRHAFKICTVQLKHYLSITQGFPLNNGFYVFFWHGLHGLDKRFRVKDELFVALSENVLGCYVFDIAIIAALERQEKLVRYYPKFYQHPLLMFSNPIIMSLINGFPFSVEKLKLTPEDFLFVGESRRIILYNNILANKHLPLFSDLAKKYEFSVSIIYMVKRNSNI